MNLPTNFHDGSFDGFRLTADKSVQLFLRTSDQEAFTLVPQGVKALNISGVRQGNIIFDVVIRKGQQLTSQDMQDEYDLAPGAAQIEKALTTSREQNLQLLEMSTSYGAEGLILFETFGVNPGS